MLYCSLTLLALPNSLTGCRHAPDLRQQLPKARFAAKRIPGGISGQREKPAIVELVGLFQALQRFFVAAQCDIGGGIINLRHLLAAFRTLIELLEPPAPVAFRAPLRHRLLQKFDRREVIRIGAHALRTFTTQLSDDLEVATNHSYVLAGHRRLATAKHLGLETVPVIYFDSHDDLAMIEAIVESNRARDKTLMQTIREAQALADAEKERAKRRQEEAQTKTGEKNKPTSYYN